MDNSNINLISLRIRHHASASGYDQLIEKMGANSIITRSQLNIMQRGIARGARGWIQRSGSMWYQRVNFISELGVSKKLLFGKDQVFHFLYGENSYRYSGVCKSFNKNNHLVATYHTPPDRFREVVTSRKFLKNLDAIVVVSTMQQEFFAELVGQERVFYVPHGIDTKYFSPSEDDERDNDIFECICVGGHLRDFETLIKTASLLRKANQKIKITVVAPPRYNDLLSQCPDITLCSGVSDEELLRLYRNADLLLLPLLDCTANNALLEGMSCGLPVVTTDLPGVRDYANEACALFAKKRDASELARKVLELSNDEDKLSRFGKQSRLQAMNFKWDIIVKQLYCVYSEISN